MRKSDLIFGVLFTFTSIASATPPLNFPDTLIVPGKRIGGLVLGDGHNSPGIPEPDIGDSAMGGKESGTWLLGAHRGDLGMPFHRPDEITEFSQEDMEHDSAAHPGKVTGVAVFTTSPRFATADHIHCGSTLDEIRAKYPDLTADTDPRLWPLYGNVRSYLDEKAGIDFVVQESSGRCVRIGVIQPRPVSYNVYYNPLAASGDYSIGDGESEIGHEHFGGDIVGGIYPGMRRARVLALLGAPLKQVEAYEAEWLYWRVPAQDKSEKPGFSVRIQRDAVTEIRVTSPVFLVGSTGYVGCSFQLAHDSIADFQKIETGISKNEVCFGSIWQGIVYEFDAAGKVCVAVGVFAPPAIGRFALPDSR